MEQGDQLTNLQKVALEGEVAYTVSTASHDAEIKLRIYYLLKETSDELKPFFIEAFKEAVTFDRAAIDKLYYETLNNEVPVWLWIEGAIADIKESVRLMDSGMSNSLSIDKQREKKKIAESAFVQFARKTLLVSPDATEQLLNNILEDNELSFLHTSAFYLRSCCEEIRDCGTVQDKIPERIMNCRFSLRNLLSVHTEMNVLSSSTKKESHIAEDEEVIHVARIEIDHDMTEEEISKLISQKLKQQPRFKYVVKKIFKDTQISTNIRSCDTMKEAIEFIREITEQYPELKSTSKFMISKERTDER